MNSVFLLLRILTGIAAVAALAILQAIVLLHSGAAFMRESVSVVGYVATLFTSGFTRGTAPASAGWVISSQQIGLAVLFVAMFVSVFLPGAKIMLHLIAALAAMAVIWYARMLLTGAMLEILCFPLLAFWFCYYTMCLFWSGSQPVPIPAVSLR